MTVSSNDEGNVGFPSGRNRVNVAITRARSMLLIFGNKKTLEYDPIWSKYLTHIGSFGSDLENSNMSWKDVPTLTYTESKGKVVSGVLEINEKENKICGKVKGGCEGS